MRVFPCDPAHGKTVASIWRDIDFQQFLTKSEKTNNVLTWCRNLAFIKFFCEHDNSIMLIRQAQFAFGTNHAVRNVPVGLACRDNEITRKDAARKDNYNQVSHFEVMGTANNAA